MVIYLVTFFLTSCLFELTSKKIDKSIKIFLIFFALLIPSIVAGVRASSIGTDLKIYGISSFDLALHSSSLKSFYNSINLDYGFYFLTYISSRIVPDYHFALFVYQFVTFLFIYLFSNECYKKFGISKGFICLIYMLMLYNVSLNIMRQCIAVAVSSYAFTFVWKKKPFFYIVFMLLAFLFHSTSLIAVSLLPLYWLFGKRNYRCIEQRFLISFFIVFSLIILFLFNQIIQYMVGIGLVNSRYLEYVGDGVFAQMAIGRPNYANLIVQPILLIIVLFNLVNTQKYNEGLNFFVICSILAAFIQIFSPMFSSFIQRISYYFIPFQILFLGMTIKSLNYKDKFYLYNLAVFLFLSYGFSILLLEMVMKHIRIYSFGMNKFGCNVIDLC